MAALAKDRFMWRRDGHINRVALKAGARIFKGALVCTDGGYGVPAADTSGLRFAGVALESADNTAGANGAKEIRVWQTGVFPVAKPGAAPSDIGAEVACVDDQTVNLLSVTTADIRCGRVVAVLNSGEVEVKLDGYAY